MPAGRPTKYEERFCDIVILRMSQGAAVQELPYYFGANIDSIYEWAKVHPEFSDALKKGKELSQAWWMRKGRKNLKCKDFNYAGWFMNMRNRFRWSNADNVQNDNTESMTDRATEHAKQYDKS